MKRCVLLTAIFLGATSFSTIAVAQAPGQKDVAQLLYEVNKGLHKQEGKIEATHEALVNAHDRYVENPNEHTYATLMSSAQTDVKAVEDYNEMVIKAKKIQQEIEVAAKEFYEETPAPKEEVVEGPPPPPPPPPGGQFPKEESIIAEKDVPEGKLVERLKEEIEVSGGPSSDFTKQLKAQATRLKSVESRIEAEKSKPYVQKNPTAKKEMNDLQSILSKALDARRKAMNPDKTPLKPGQKEPMKPVASQMEKRSPEKR